MDIFVNLELAPTHFGDRPLSPFERFLFAAVHHLNQQGKQIMKTLDDVLAQVQAESTVEASLEAFAQNLTDQRDALKAQVTELQAELEAAGADTTKIDAIAAALDSNDSVLNTTAEQLSAAVTAGTPPPAPAPEPAPEPAPPAPAVFGGPTSVTGISGTPLSGQFAVIGDGGPFTFAQSGDPVGDFTTTADGFFAMNPTAPVGGSVTITATAADGTALEPVSVSISIS